MTCRNIEILEVGPRDGLQNEKEIIATADKISFIRQAIDAGVRRIEIASFVNPRRVPQMADAEEVVAGLGVVEDVTRIGLVMNEKGAERAIACGIDELGAVAIASDEFGIRNQGQTSFESVEVAKRIIAMGHAASRSAQVTIGVSFGCPFDGNTPPDHVVEMVRRLAEANPREIAIADTIGVATPGEVSALVAKLRAVIDPIPLRAHFHNTRNTGIANVWAAVEAGVQVIDASIGGLGGCPFAPGATGNVATEDVVYLLGRAGVDHGLDLGKLIDTANWMSSVMGKTLPSMLAKAGGYSGKSVEA